MTQHAVVDTNVLAVAEGLHDGASPECVAACTNLLRKVSEGNVLVVADSEASGEQILSEYLNAMKKGKKAGIGTKLATKLWRIRHGGSACHTVEITPNNPDDGGFKEVPDRLKDFDRDDLKWIAVSTAAASSPPIFQALDSEWWARRQDFSDSGIDVQFLCVSDLF